MTRSRGTIVGTSPRCDLANVKGHSRTLGHHGVLFLDGFAQFRHGNGGARGRDQVSKFRQSGPTGCSAGWANVTEPGDPYSSALMWEVVVEETVGASLAEPVQRWSLTPFPVPGHASSYECRFRLETRCWPGHALGPPIPRWHVKVGHRDSDASSPSAACRLERHRSRLPQPRRRKPVG